MRKKQKYPDGLTSRKIPPLPRCWLGGTPCWTPGVQKSGWTTSEKQPEVARTRQRRGRRATERRAGGAGGAGWREATLQDDHHNGSHGRVVSRRPRRWFSTPPLIPSHPAPGHPRVRPPLLTGSRLLESHRRAPHVRPSSSSRALQAAAVAPQPGSTSSGGQGRARRPAARSRLRARRSRTPGRDGSGHDSRYVRQCTDAASPACHAPVRPQRLA
ncbi:unnamed protein product [Prorocentrum cordatum]|uniref:Uncharacterized protein n=1 Tax=Prorocentrum cordatum TaxID=2364126 RepID=A0ABN9U3U1_9DINO|nr:unnamed protein product [Polarella glacialis]